MLRDQRSYAIIGTAQEAGQGNAAGPDSHRHSRDGGRRRANIVIPATAGIHGGGRLRWGSRLHGNDGGRRRTTHGRRRRTHNRHSRDGGRRRATSSFPRRRESTAGGDCDGVPVYTGTTVGDGAPHTVGGGAPTIVIPATAGIHGGETAMGSRLHGNDGGRRRTTHGRRQRTSHRLSRDGRRRRTHIVIPRDGGRRRTHIVIPRDGGRRRTHIVIPATAGIHGGGRLRWVPVLHGNDGGRRRRALQGAR